MPPTTRQVNANLGIELDSPWTIFSPGDIVTGRVTREQHEPSPGTRGNLVVFISLHGRSKVKVTEENSEIVRVWRGRIPLIDEKRSKMVLRGPQQAPSGTRNRVLLQWPFSITIPDYVDDELFPSDGSGGAKDVFFPWDTKIGSAGQVLPSSFKSSLFSQTAEIEAFIEYYLEAHLPIQEVTNMSRLAKLPIFIRRVSPKNHFILDENFKTHNHDVSASVVSTQQHDAEMRTTKPSLADIIRGKLGGRGTADARRLCFYSVEVKIPKAIQLDSRNFIPFLVRVKPIWENTDKRIRHVPQKIKLNGLQLHIVSITETAAETKRIDRGETRLELEREAASGALEFPLLSEEMDKHISYGEVDAGQWLKFRLPKQWISRAGIESPNRPSADFVTYNMRHSHQIKYKFTLEIAGEWVTVTGVDDLVILRPSETS